jgi:DNA-binding Lrp family transcriptional regulator
MAAMKQLPQVMEWDIMLGESDAMLRVVVADLDDYRRFQTTHLTRANGIQNVKTDLPSQIVKQTYALPL